MLSSGTIVDENVELTFQLGDGEVIDGGFTLLLSDSFTYIFRIAFFAS
jgi:hypothetical protein